MNPRHFLIAIGVACVMAVFASSGFRVEDGEQAVITSGDTWAGSPVLQPGLHLRIPLLQKVHRFKPQSKDASFENSFVLAPYYIQYLTDSESQFGQEAAELKNRIGSARHVMLGFAAGLDISFGDTTATQRNIETIVRRAKENGLIVHIAITSGFFHGWNDLREQAIREDVRNAQWFADGAIAPPADLKNAEAIPHSIWITPSRYALPLRSKIEAGVRTIGAYLAHAMAQSPDTLVTISGDGEVEYSFERSFGAGAEGLKNADVVYTDYSPFMLAEFRDSLKKAYSGDRSPASDDDGNGRTFNRDFGTVFETWNLRYYDNSGPIPYDSYMAFKDKLPQTGPNFIPGGFDAPRQPRSGDAFWNAWVRFRESALKNWVRDFAGWITTSPDEPTGFTIPLSRYYTHQIPADFLFGKPDNLRLQTSASVLGTAFIDPVASSGITAFNVFNGSRYARTTSPALFSALSQSANNWGILEYNPSVPSSNDDNYYLGELRQLYSYRPHVIVPFAWSDSPEMKRYRIKDSSFERSLRRFVSEIGNTPWFSLRSLPGAVGTLAR